MTKSLKQPKRKEKESIQLVESLPSETINYIATFCNVTY